jgi:N-acetylglutamate synthase-like GNAT family acetyltransferase
MELRPYVSADREACLQVFDSNVPAFLNAASRVDFETFLDHPPGPYFVMEHDGRVLGCGGYKVTPESGHGELVWGMIRNDAQRLGLGRLLLMFRLREVGKVGGIHSVRAETSRQAARFFEGQGFKMAGAVENRVEMVKKLTVCA